MCQIDVCTCTRLFETMPGVQPPSPTPFSGQPSPPLPALCSSFRSCYHPYHMPYQPLLATYRYSIRRPPTSPISPSPFPSSVALHLTSANTASPLLSSATHTITLPISFHARRSIYSPFASVSFPFCFHFRLPQMPDPIRPAGTVPYGTVSTGTPARSLKENTIIRRTSTNELIVGASRYRQYWQVLYSTSPGATRL